MYANKIDEKTVCAAAVAELIAIEIHHRDSQCAVHSSLPFVSIIIVTTTIIAGCLLGLLEPISWLFVLLFERVFVSS